VVFLAILGLVVGVGTRLATLAYVSFFGGGGEVYWGKVSSFPFGASADKLFTFSVIAAMSRSPTTLVLSSICLVFLSSLADRSKIAWPCSSTVLWRAVMSSIMCLETLLKWSSVGGSDGVAKGVAVTRGVIGVMPSGKDGVGVGVSEGEGEFSALFLSSLCLSCIACHARYRGLSLPSFDKVNFGWIKTTIVKEGVVLSLKGVNF